MATSKRPYSVYIAALRILPFLMTVMMLIYVIVFVFGFRVKFLELLSDPGVVASIFIFGVSKHIGMCKLHRALLIYSTVIGLCIDFNQSVGFGVCLYPISILAIVVGLVLVVLSLTKVHLFCHS